MFLAVIFFTLICCICMLADCYKPRNFPPGPIWIPIFGSALAILKARKKTGMLVKAVNYIAESYSGKELLGFKIGKEKVVFTVTPEALSEMFLSDDCDGRPLGIFYESRTFENRFGLIFVDGEFWQDTRRFVMRHLKEFGFARRGMAETIQNESEFFLADMKSKFGNNTKLRMNMDGLCDLYILNTMWKLISGKRYNSDETELKHLQNLLRELFKCIDMSGTLFSYFPFLRYIAPNYSGYNQYLQVHNAIHEFSLKELELHRSNFKIENEPIDLMEVYLNKIEVDGARDIYSEKQLLSICLDLFVAGSETTNKVFGFCLLSVIRNPAVQEKCQQEIDRVIGRDRLPLCDDKPNMPYCEATILEGCRKFMIYTISIPHRAIRDTKLCGYDIPKDTMLLGNFKAFMLNEEVWGTDAATCFRPERFIKDSKLVQPKNFYPFGLGKHRCMGELMAKSNLFIFLVTLLQNFKFEIPDGCPIPTDEIIDGATPSIIPYDAMISLR